LTVLHIDKPEGHCKSPPKRIPHVNNCNEVVEGTHNGCVNLAVNKTLLVYWLFNRNVNKMSAFW